LPTTAASAASGCTGLLRAFLVVAAFFGVGIGQLERAGLGCQAKNHPCFSGSRERHGESQPIVLGLFQGIRQSNPPSGRWPRQAWLSARRNQNDGSVQGAVSALYSSSWASVRPCSRCSHLRRPPNVSCHHRAHGLPPRTTSAVASWRMLSRPQRSKSTGSLRPKVGSYPREVHHSPPRYAAMETAVVRMRRIHWSKCAPIAVLVNEPSPWPQTLHHAPDCRFLLVGEPKQRQSRADHIERARAERMHGIVKDIVLAHLKIRQINVTRLIPAVVFIAIFVAHALYVSACRLSPFRLDGLRY
jgi:hypothetical protein